MLTYNLNRLFRLRGIHNPVQFLTEKGYHKDTAYRIIRKRACSLQFYQIEDFCKWLNCTPNDLFEWTPDKGEKPEDYPSLLQLMPIKSSDIAQLLKDVPMNKIPDFLKKVEAAKKEV